MRWSAKGRRTTEQNSVLASRLEADKFEKVSNGAARSPGGAWGTSIISSRWRMGATSTGERADVRSFSP
jgi:hypothetical protein